MNAAGEAIYHSAQIYPNDPPDCIAKDLHGNNIAIEVTELVDQDAFRPVSREESMLKIWNRDELIETIVKVVSEKDAIEDNSQQFSRMVLIIYTDEYALRYRDCVDHLRGYRFPGRNRLDDVYMLFSFDPDEGEICPYLWLSFQ